MSQNRFNFESAYDAEHDIASSYTMPKHSASFEESQRARTSTEWSDETQINSCPYSSISDEELIRAKKALEEALNNNFLKHLHHEKTRALRNESKSYKNFVSNSSRTMGSFNSEESNIEDEEIDHLIFQLKDLSLRIAEYKAENEMKALELKKMQSQLKMDCPQVSKEGMTAAYLERRLQKTQIQSYESKEKFYIEYNVGLSLIFAELQAENDRINLQLKQLRNILYSKQNESILSNYKVGVGNQIMHHIVHRINDTIIKV